MPNAHALSARFSVNSGHCHARFRKRGALIWHAFTLIEVLAVILIVGVLVVLLLPAVQASREASRKAQCMNHLRQIGIALSSHHASLGKYPVGMRPDPLSSPGRLRAAGPLSLHYQLLPYLEQTAAFNAMNVQEMGGANAYIDTRAANSTIASTGIAVFLCPSEAQDLSPGNSYRGSTGPGVFSQERSIRRGGGGVFPGLLALAAPDITDGLSATVGVSERVEGSGSNRYRRDRDFWYSGLYLLKPLISPDEMANACAALPGSPAAFWQFAGRSWVSGRYADTLYNHVEVPNWSGDDCSAELPFGTPGSISGGVIAARSYHPGGVHALTMDGAVRFTKNSISVAVWRALASRAGGEAQPAE